MTTVYIALLVVLVIIVSLGFNYVRLPNLPIIAWIKLAFAVLSTLAGIVFFNMFLEMPNVDVGKVFRAVFLIICGVFTLVALCCWVAFVIPLL